MNQCEERRSPDSRAERETGSLQIGQTGQTGQIESEYGQYLNEENNKRWASLEYLRTVKWQKVARNGD